MAKQKQDKRQSGDQRDGDRRIASKMEYDGPERRKGDRRQHERRSS